MLSIVLPRQTGEVRGGAKRSRNISRKTRFPWAVHVVRFFDYASTPSLLPRLSGENNVQNDRYVDSIN